jgi:drug/metabolite transporter (DMT)-like permease
MSGPAWMVLGIAVFALLDLNTKWLSAGYGMGQVLLLRYGVMLLVLLPFARAGGLSRRPGLHIARGLLMAVSSAGFFHAFAHLPLFDGYVVYFTAPFIVMAMARALLAERVPPAAWGWAAVGFAGVLVALLPRMAAGAAHATGPLAAAFAGTVTYSLTLILTRRAATEPMGALLLWPGIIGTLFSAPLAATDWTPPDAGDWVLLLLNGLFWAGAIGCISRAVQKAEPSRLAVLDFTAIVWVIAFDWFVFGHGVGWAELAGAGLVIASCVAHARVMAKSAQAPAGP